jgi:acetyl esterase/lipase
MTIKNQIDPQLRVALDAHLERFPGGLGTMRDPVERRVAHLDSLRAAAAGMPENSNVTKEDREVPRLTGGGTIHIRIYRPVNNIETLPAIFAIHGGGMFMGSIEADDAHASTLCEDSGTVTIAIDYRLAPEFPYPAGLDDCFTVLKWIFDNSIKLGIDSEKVAVYGESAGGNLALALGLMARDLGAPKIAFLAPIYPMLDDRSTTPSSYEVIDVGVWDRHEQLEAWQWYLGSQSGSADIPIYAAPGRAEDFANLPPTFIDVGTIDLFRDEVITLVGKIASSGVPVEFHLYPGAYHAAELFAPEADLSKLIWRNRITALRSALFPNREEK